MANKNGMAKNLEVVSDEWREFGIDQWYNLQRFGAALGQVGHISVAFISSTYRALPRTMTYITVGFMLYHALRAFIA